MTISSTKISTFQPSDDIQPKYRHFSPQTIFSQNIDISALRRYSAKISTFQPSDDIQPKYRDSRDKPPESKNNDIRSIYRLRRAAPSCAELRRAAPSCAELRLASPTKRGKLCLARISRYPSPGNERKPSSVPRKLGKCIASLDRAIRALRLFTYFYCMTKHSRKFVLCGIFLVKRAFLCNKSVTGLAGTAGAMPAP